MLNQLFGSAAGLLSLGIIVIMIVVMVFGIRLIFKKSMDKQE